ncbi:MAG: gliding motility-associated ABC transporter permease subunit GldF [Calditrichia bacterium]
MKKMFVIAKREFKSYFYSPVGYIVLGLFVILTGIFYYLYLNTFVDMCLQASFYEQQYRGMRQTLNVNFHMIRPYIYNVAIISIFIIPLISMRLFAEEKKQGTIELLFTNPVTLNQIIIGKFMAGLFFYGILLLAPFLYILLLYFFGTPEIMPVISAFIGLFLMGSVILAFGLFISSLTENQIVAAAGAFAVSLLLWIIGWGASYSGPVLGKFFEYMSVINHFEDFAQGVLDTSHFAYYVLFTIFGLYLSRFSLDSVKWRS